MSISLVYLSGLALRDEFVYCIIHFYSNDPPKMVYRSTHWKDVEILSEKEVIIMKHISSVREFSGEITDKPIRELISDFPINGKEQILKYLKSFEPDSAAGMSLIDEITGETVRTGVNGYGDLEFFWDTRDIYHFEKYNLEINKEFIEHVLKK